MSKLINPLTSKKISINSNIYKLLTNDTIFKNENNVLIPLNKKMYFFDEKKGVWLHNKFKKQSKPAKSKTRSQKKSKQEKEPEPEKQEIFLLEDNKKQEPEKQEQKKQKPKKEKPKILLLERKKRPRRGFFTEDENAINLGFTDATERRKYSDRQKMLFRRKEDLYKNPEKLKKLKEFFQKRKRLQLDYNNYYLRNKTKFTEEELQKRNDDLLKELIEVWLPYDDRLIYDDYNEDLYYYIPLDMEERKKIWDKFRNIWENYKKKNGITWTWYGKFNQKWSVSKEEKKEALQNKMTPQDYINYIKILNKR